MSGENLCNICVRRPCVCLSAQMPSADECALFDPANCAACAAFVARNAPQGPKVEVKSELWEAAKLKAKQLESEIYRSGGSRSAIANMQHTLSKLWMFATDAWEHEVIRPAQRRSDEARAIDASPRAVPSSSPAEPIRVRCWCCKAGMVVAHDPRGVALAELLHLLDGHLDPSGTLHLTRRDVHRARVLVDTLRAEAAQFTRATDGQRTEEKKP